MDPPCDSRGQEDCREKYVDMLVVACGDSPKNLEPTEHAFDEVADFVGLGVVSVGCFRLGAEVGVPAPTNEVVSALVRGLEESFW